MWKNEDEMFALMKEKLYTPVVGDILVSGQGVNKLHSFGRVCVAHDEEEALRNFQDGDILVVPETSNTLLPILKKASGIVTEKGVFRYPFAEAFQAAFGQ